MSCDYTEKVSLLIDGELPPIEARAVERHLLECAACQQVRADFLSLRGQIGSYTPALAAAPPRWALARVLSTNKGTAARSRPERVFRKGRLSPALATVIATVFICFAIISILLFRAQQRGAGIGSSPPNAVAKDQPDVIPPSGPPSPAAADPGADPGLANSNNSEKVVRGAEPKRRNTEPGETAGVVKQTNTSTQAERRGRHPRLPAPPEDSVASDDVSLNANGATATSIGHIRAADTETLTAQHLEQSELLLRAFRNLRNGTQAGKDDLGYERRRAQQLFYQNVLLQREAVSSGDVQMATLLESLEPILLDIANLSARPPGDEVRAIKDRVERQNLVALLQINSTSLARAYE